MDTKKISLETILENTPETITVKEYDGTVQVKFPTTRDKLDAKRDAKRLTEGLPNEDSVLEENRLLALKMIVEPKITIEDYLNGNDTTVSIILDAVHMWYSLRIKGINAKRQESIKSFLEQMKES